MADPPTEYAKPALTTDIQVKKSVGQPAYAFYGHHKCATMWFNTICSSLCRRLGLNFGHVHNEDQFDRDLSTYCQSRHIDFLSYSNADIEFPSRLPPHKAFHVIRDPRDIVVSAYFSHLASHPTEGWQELIPYREKLAGLPQEEGLALEIENRKREFDHLNRWDYEQDHVLEIRFEDIVSSGYETLLKAFEFLDLLDPEDYTFWKRARTLGNEINAYTRARWEIGLLPTPHKLHPAELLALSWRNRFQAKSGGRSQGRQDVGSHYRKGQPGDWKNHLNNDHKNLFRDLYPGLIPRLGYEDTDTW